MNNKNKSYRLRAWVCGFLFIIIVICLYYYVSSLFLSFTQYTIEADLFTPIRIVQLSDLHNSEFGKDNGKLVAAVQKQDPDLIVMTGDMLNGDDPNTDIVECLIQKLSTVAPVYYGYGNHEATWEQNYKQDLHNALSEAGAVVLDCKYDDVEVNGQKIRIGGYMGYWLQPHMMTKDPYQQQLEKDFYDVFKNTERFRILLNHIPTQWVDWNYIDIDSSGLVFSGHYHGGTIRIPIIDRGLFAPYVGWFPPYTKGVFVGEKSTCVLSAGLGNEHHIPRFNNPPEVVVVDLIPRNN